MPEASLTTIEFAYPYLGLHEDAAYTNQPEHTTFECRNVRGYDLTTRRDLGGQRPGMGKITGAINNFTTSQPISLIRTAFLASTAQESICYLQGGHVFGGAMGNGTGSFFQLSDPGSTSGYTTGVAVDMVGAFGAFWLSDTTLPLRKVDLVTPAITYPTATAGTIPSYATILTLYRGRLFHAGFASDPFNYIASRSGDPLDYDEGAIDQAGAFAGNNTPQAGLLGDRITALIPFGDVRMVIGMQSSLAVMRGDPKAGGDIAYLSREVGIAGKNAWAQTPEGHLYFMGKDGLYLLKSPDTPPICVSRGRLDRTLGKINWGTHDVIMAWDPIEIGIKIVIVPKTNDDVNYPYGMATAVFWDQRKNAFWYDLYTYGAPRAIAPLRGPSAATGPILLFGGYDGWLRSHFQAGSTTTIAKDDDGTKISSYVFYPPQMPYGPNVRAKLTSFRPLWSGSGSWVMYATDDPWTIQGGSWNATVGGSISGSGYQSVIRSRIRGACLTLRLDNFTGTASNYAWTVDLAKATVAPSGRVRA